MTEARTAAASAVAVESEASSFRRLDEDGEVPPPLVLMEAVVDARTCWAASWLPASKACLCFASLMLTSCGKVRALGFTTVVATDVPLAPYVSTACAKHPTRNGVPLGEEEKLLLEPALSSAPAYLLDWLAPPNGLSVSEDASTASPPDPSSTSKGAVPNTNSSGKSSSTHPRAVKVKAVSKATPTCGDTARLPDEGGSFMTRESREKALCPSLSVAVNTKVYVLPAVKLERLTTALRESATEATATPSSEKGVATSLVVETDHEVEATAVPAVVVAAVPSTFTNPLSTLYLPAEEGVAATMATCGTVPTTTSTTTNAGALTLFPAPAAALETTRLKTYVPSPAGSEAGDTASVGVLVARGRFKAVSVASVHPLEQVQLYSMASVSESS
mmetsp:Transcript_24577/g.50435  ORF Transcript_24577/g.50435 Transcript_24577/m.50435 type:complete len:389 (-) Transcript_24577:876-2042(-)